MEICRRILAPSLLTLFVFLGGSVGQVVAQMAPGVGSRAPDFSLRLFSGETIRLSDFKGRTVLVNFFASW